MVFSLPAESNEKIGLGINALLAMIVFLMAMTQRLPPTQMIPLAGMYMSYMYIFLSDDVKKIPGRENPLERNDSNVFYP